MTKWLRPAAESWPGRFLSSLLRRYFIHDVGRQSAALAYYLLFMLFPFLIFLSSLLGLLDLDISGITRSLEALLPAGVLDVVETYLSYVTTPPVRPCSGSAWCSPSTSPCGRRTA